MRRQILAFLLISLPTVSTSMHAEQLRDRASTGRLTLTFTQRSALSSPGEARRRFTDESSGQGLPADLKDYDLADESFDVFVPPTYKPDVPHGLLVWVGVTEFDRQWFDVLARHKLIFVSPNDLWRREGPIHTRRVGLPIDAVHNIKQAYNIDSGRVYVCGFSAGAGMASGIAVSYPEVFNGGVFLMGGVFYTIHKEPNGRPEPTVLAQTPALTRASDKMKQDQRLVLVRGQNDTIYPPKDDQAQFDALRLDGFERVNYLVVPGIGHNHPPVPWFQKAIVALEASPKTAPDTRPTDKPNPSQGQIGQARRILATAQYYLANGKSDRAKNIAKAHLQRVLDEYPTTPSAAKARELLKTLDPATTAPASKTG
jgi:predicted esterase